jgi:hypothetical protein
MSEIYLKYDEIVVRYIPGNKDSIFAKRSGQNEKQVQLVEGVRNDITDALVYGEKITKSEYNNF